MEPLLAENKQLKLNIFVIAAIILTSSSHIWAFEKYHCKESWYDKSIESSKINYPDRSQDCQKNDGNTKKLGRYQIIGGKAYWAIVDKRRESPCSGKGVGALGQMLDPVCYLPAKLQTHHNYEERSYFLVSSDGENFRLLQQKTEGLNEWQRSQLTRYAVDSTSVYHNSEMIKEADINSFEAIFPFGNQQEAWSVYTFAQDRHQSYLDGKPMPKLQWSKIRFIEPKCPDDEHQCNLRDVDYPPGHHHMGQLDQDIFYFNYGSPITRFPGLAAKDFIYYTAGLYDFRIRSRGKYYRIQPHINAPATLELEKQDR